MIVFERDARPVFVNQGMRDLLGRLRSVGPPIRALCRGQGFRVSGSELHYPPARWPVPRALRGEDALVDDVAWTLDGRERRLEVHASPLLDDCGDVTHVVAAFQDLTLRRAPPQARHLGDPVTRLPTREVVEATYAGVLERTRRRPGRGVACILLRVLGFDDVVLRHGEKIGDELLRGIAERLRESVRRIDHPHRIGPATFLVVCEAVTNHMQAVRLARRLTTDLYGDYDTPIGGLRVEIAAGASFSQDPSERLSHLARRAGRVALDETLVDA